MSKTPIARVILLSDGSVHLALSNMQTVLCTNHSLFALLLDPFSFIEKDFRRFIITTGKINNRNIPLEKIPGLTLVTIFKDKSILFEFPEILRTINDIILEIEDSEINLKEFFTQTAFEDNKQFLLNIYLNLVNQLRSETIINRKINVDPNLEEQLISEAVNTILAIYNLNQPASKTLDYSDTSEYEATIAMPESNMVSIREYAKIHDIPHGTVQAYVMKNKFASKEKVGNKWFIDKNEKPIGLGTTKKYNPLTNKKEKRIRIKGSSFEDVQKYIEARKLFSPEMARFIRTYEEVKYYESHHYHEIEWDGQLGLIIDINPEYYCEEKGKTNRELIISGGSPVVPGKFERPDPFSDEPYIPIYHIHHVGQLVNSPFAIIPEQDHNSKELYSIFHSHSSGNEDLHSKEFEMRKQAFWNNYLRYYDTYSGFKNIPYYKGKH